MITLGLLSLTACRTQKVLIHDPEGNIAYKVTLPEDFDTATGRCPMVLLQHGDSDNIVPLWCSERYLQTYGPAATLKVIEGENHTITRRRPQVIANTVEFFRKVFELK